MEVTELLDGRRARGLRTREAIIEALFELVAAGDVTPTAQRIADGAGVSVRSVYQHFSDAEGLFREAAVRQAELIEGRDELVDPGLPLDRRIDRFVIERSTTLEITVPFTRAARLLEPSSDSLRQARLELEARHRAELERVFATELGALKGASRRDVVGALELLTSEASWDFLRERGTSVSLGRRIMRTGVADLLRGARPSRSRS